MTLEEWEAANPEYCKGWDDALRAASELTFLAYCKEFNEGDVVHDTPMGRVLAQQRRLLRRPTMLEASILFGLGFIDQESISRLAERNARLSRASGPRDGVERPSAQRPAEESPEAGSDPAKGERQE